MAMGPGRWSTCLGLALLAYQAAVATNWGPLSWAVGSLCAWLCHTTVVGWRRMSAWEQRHLLWGMCSLLAFLHFLVTDPSFQSWADVFFFCGPRLEYCTCGFRWNSRGWVKAAVLWNFTLSSALALQKLVIGLGLNGLLPGEDLVTKESFISIGWRLIPYWLNNWEQQWGAECSSMIFELPHFALELLVVLPCAQIIAARLKILAQPHVRLPARRLPPPLPARQQQVQQQAQQAQQQEPGRDPEPLAEQPDQAQQGAGDEAGEMDSLVPDPLRCVWVHDSEQRRLLPRLRANIKMMAVVALITAVAMFNAIVMPLGLEGQVSGTARSEQIQRLREELGYAAGKGRLAEMAHWYEGFIEADLLRAASKAGNGSSSTTTTTNNSSSTGSGGGGERLWGRGTDVVQTAAGAGSGRELARSLLAEAETQRWLTAAMWSNVSGRDGGGRRGRRRAQPGSPPAALVPLLSWAARQQGEGEVGGGGAAHAAHAEPPLAAEAEPPAAAAPPADTAATAAAAAADRANSSAAAAAAAAGWAAGVAVAGEAAAAPAAAATSQAASSSALAVSVLAMRVAGGAPWPSVDNVTQITAELAGAEMGAAHAVDAQLAVLCTLWEPLVPVHWMRAMYLAANASSAPPPNSTSLLWALQFRPRPSTPALLAATRAALAALQPGGQLAAGEEEKLAAEEEAVQRLGNMLGALVGDGRSTARAARHSSGSTSSSSSSSGGGGFQAGSPDGGAAAEARGGSGGAEPQQGAAGAAHGASLPEGARLSLARLLLAAAAAADLDPSDPTALGEGWLAQEAEEGRPGTLSDLAWLRGRQAQWESKGCVRDPRLSPLYRMLNKHATELRRMQEPEHHALIPLVEASLAVMRLSCENFFSLAAVFAGYLLFRDPPPMAQRAIVGVARLSHVFQRAILYAFPAVCWSYGAGFVFSSFVSVVFWTGPLLRALERMRTAATSVVPRAWHPATPQELERMGGQCAICWGDMGQQEQQGQQQEAGAGGGGAPAAGMRPGGGGGTQLEQQRRRQAENEREAARGPSGAVGGGGAGQPIAAGADEAEGEAEGGAEGGAAALEGEASEAGSSRAMGLPCGHAYHEACLLQWLHQCYGQARQPTCPMCQAAIRLRVSYRLPRRRQGAAGAAGAAGEPGEGGAEAAGGLGPGGRPAHEPGIPGIQALVQALQDDFRNRFEPVLVVGMDHQDFLAWEEGEPEIPGIPPPAPLDVDLPEPAEPEAQQEQRGAAAAAAPEPPAAAERLPAGLAAARAAEARARAAEMAHLRPLGQPGGAEAGSAGAPPLQQPAAHGRGSSRGSSAEASSAALPSGSEGDWGREEDDQGGGSSAAGAPTEGPVAAEEAEEGPAPGGQPGTGPRPPGQGRGPGLIRRLITRRRARG